MESNGINVDQRIIRSIEEMGFEQFTPIQQQTIPLLLEGKDVIGQAQTGTGKTAAFGIPILQNVDPMERNLQAIVLCPTRELAVQAADELHRFAKYMHNIRILPIYGGADINRQIKALHNVQIVVGTPGRVMDHMRRHTLKLDHLKMVVLDEADEMLNMGFREDIECILKDVPSERQTALFSATMPQAILDITHEYQKEDAKYVRVTPKELTIPLVKQYYYEVRRDNKEEVTVRLLDYYNPKRCLIFCNTKKMTDELALKLKGRGYQAEALHGDLSQAQRDRVMNGFRAGNVEILIATDVAARGIDVDDVEAVLNYDVPQDIEYYVHRIGRTGRAGKTGRSFTLVVGRDIYKIRDIERICKTKIKARRVPSVSDVTNAKAEKTLSEVLAVYREQDLSKMLPIVEHKLNEENLTAMELAAAFLKLHMGEEPEEIPEIVHRDPRTGNRTDRGRRGNGEDRSRRGGRGGEQARRNSVRDGRDGEQTRRPVNDRRKNDAKKNDAKKNDVKKNDSRKRIQREVTKVSESVERKKRHAHPEREEKRQKLITGENRDLGYDADTSIYKNHREEYSSMELHSLEIKTKDVRMNGEPKKKNFGFFGNAKNGKKKHNRNTGKTNG